MTSHHDQFLVYDKYDGGMVYLGDDFPLNILGYGRVLIRFLDGRVKGISQVLHVHSTFVMEPNINRQT